MAKKASIFDRYEIQTFVHAVKVGGLRSDARQNAFELLEAYGENELLEKYDGMTKAAQKKFRIAARNSVKQYEAGDTSYSMEGFEDFLQDE